MVKCMVKSEVRWLDYMQFCNLLAHGDFRLDGYTFPIEDGCGGRLDFFLYTVQCLMGVGGHR
jgi:hypothetical protein